MRKVWAGRLCLPFFFLFLASCSRKEAGGVKPAPVFSGAPCFIIVVDTLRSDRLPFYGYTNVETPALSALRQDAILFEKAYSHVPLTLPAHASLFTGTLPAVHGVLDNGGYQLNPSLPTMASSLKEAGYTTGAAVSSVVLTGASGISRGFDVYEDTIEPEFPGQPVNRVQRSGDETASLLVRWLSEVKNEKVFGFLHLYEPHTPYEPKEPFRSKFQDPYDGEVATADAIAGFFLDELKRRGLYDRSLIIFLSDHGEGLGEHGEAEHGIFVYRESIQVPLLVKLPRAPGEEKPAFAGHSVAVPVQLIDLLPTVAKVLAVPGLPKLPDAVSLVDLAAGEKPPERRIFAETFFPKIRFGWSELRTLLDGRWQYIEAPKPEFYDLEKDPRGLNNLAGEKPGPLRSMKVDLEKRRTAFKAPDAVDPEHARKLASLGYLSMTSAPSEGPAPDPKDEIGTLTALKEGLGLAKAGRFEESVKVLEALLSKNPRIVDAWESYAQSLVQVGRKEDALAAIKKTVELSPPDRTNYLLAVANIALQIGQPDVALEHAGLAIARGDTGGHEVRARAYLAKNDITRAEAEARKSIETRKTRKRSYLVLADIEARQGRFKEALEITEEVRQMAGERGLLDLAGFHFLRGNLLGRLNRFDEAEAEFKMEVEKFPRYLPGWQALAMIRASRNRMPEAKAVLSEMVRVVASPDAYAAAIEVSNRIGDQAGAAAFVAEARKRYPRSTHPGS